jgi:two-component system response regulator YesN
VSDGTVGYDVAELCSDYTRATGMRCEYLEIGRAAADPSTVADAGSGVCPACNELLQYPGTGASIHRLAAYHAERYGGRYVYFCPWTLLHWASPVITDGMLAGAFICGPALLFEPDSLYFDDLRSRFGLDDATMARIVPAIEALPVITPERATSLSRLLFHLALSASDHAAGAFFADRDAFEQQSHIGEYLQHLKTMEGDKRSDLEYPLEKERELLALTAAGDHAGAVRVLDELLGVIFFTSGANLEMVKSRVLELTVLLSRAAVQGAPTSSRSSVSTFTTSRGSGRSNPWRSSLAGPVGSSRASPTLSSPCDRSTTATGSSGRHAISGSISPSASR